MLDIVETAGIRNKAKPRGAPIFQLTHQHQQSQTLVSSSGLLDIPVFVEMTTFIVVTPSHPEATIFFARSHVGKTSANIRWKKCRISVGSDQHNDDCAIQLDYSFPMQTYR